MKLFEFEAKDILKQYGIKVPTGDVATNPGEAAAIAGEIGKTVVLKSQILVSGRGKAGGILFAANVEEARDAASGLIGGSIKGNSVESLLVEEKLDISDQFYVSVTIDRQTKNYVILASTSGGVDIEEIASTLPDRIVRHWFDPEAGFSSRDATDLVSRLNISRDVADAFAGIIVKLTEIALQKDAELIEINPLVRTPSGEFITADARIIVDDNALFRHPEFLNRNSERADDTPLEAEARKQNLTYVDLSGDIGIIGNGAGLVLATLDLVDLFGGKPANFLDIGGGARPEVIKKSLLLVMSKPGVKAVLINILGGITRCDLVAQGIIEGLNEATIKKPTAVRMIGTNEEEGSRMLRQAGVDIYPSMEEAVRKVLES